MTSSLAGPARGMMAEMAVEDGQPTKLGVKRHGLP